ncbi:unnamed protein product [Pedinophyceae sp. YPF-701]|nr:unnamed protein product [Pedinophyceae sp. YPF-701]
MLQVPESPFAARRAAAAARDSRRIDCGDAKSDVAHCPACASAYDLDTHTPKRLPCGCTCCGACLDDLLILSTENGPDTKSCCPTCTRPFEALYHFADALPDDRFICNALRRLAKGSPDSPDYLTPPLGNSPRRTPLPSALGVALRARHLVELLAHSTRDKDRALAAERVKALMEAGGENHDAETGPRTDVDRRAIAHNEGVAYALSVAIGLAKADRALFVLAAAAASFLRGTGEAAEARRCEAARRGLAGNVARALYIAKTDATRGKLGDVARRLLAGGEQAEPRRRTAIEDGLPKALAYALGETSSDVAAALIAGAAGLVVGGTGEAAAAVVMALCHALAECLRRAGADGVRRMAAISLYLVVRERRAWRGGRDAAVAEVLPDVVEAVHKVRSQEALATLVDVVGELTAASASMLGEAMGPATRDAVRRLRREGRLRGKYSRDLSIVVDAEAGAEPEDVRDADRSPPPEDELQTMKRRFGPAWIRVSETAEQQVDSMADDSPDATMHGAEATSLHYDACEGALGAPAPASAKELVELLDASMQRNLAGLAPGCRFRF